MVHFDFSLLNALPKIYRFFVPTPENILLFPFRVLAKSLPGYGTQRRKPFRFSVDGKCLQCRGLARGEGALFRASRGRVFDVEVEIPYAQEALCPGHGSTRHVIAFNSG